MKKNFSNFMVLTNFFPKKTKLSQSSMRSTVTSYDYTTLTKTVEQQIELEKRRRHQIYTLLDYTLSAITYFDFFSQDTFTIIKHSKYLAQASKRNYFTSEFLLIPFLDSKFELSTLLKEYDLNEIEIGKLITSLNNIPKRSFAEKRDYFFYQIFKKVGNFSFFDKSLITKKLKNSFDVSFLFEQAAENALIRFKTPVITPEILFITMMEEENTKVSKIIKKFFPEETNWYLLRYKLIKRIHFQEVNIRAEIPKSEQYFAYLLKINLSELEFNCLIETNLLHLAVSTFRNKLITKLLHVNLFDLLEKEIDQSIQVTNTRVYSTET